jgi:hypothetical protein
MCWSATRGTRGGAWLGDGAALALLGGLLAASVTAAGLVGGREVRATCAAAVGGAALVLAVGAL